VVPAATTVTLAPLRFAASAIAKPISPEELFVRKRTGSIASRVAPVVSSRCSPARSWTTAWSVFRRSSRAAATMISESLSRPGPTVPQAISPSSGSMTSTPSARSFSKFRWVAGWCHIDVFMAGAIMMGAVDAK
jgi:hypothetical protein